MVPGLPGRRTRRNWASYGEDLILDDTTDFVRDLVCDPQTSGGLLLAVAPASTGEVEDALRGEGLHAQSIGEVVTGASGRLRLR